MSFQGLYLVLTTNAADTCLSEEAKQYEQEYFVGGKMHIIDLVRPYINSIVEAYI